jgi:uncharacterized membrane protein YphA (DoxX/SURF4 family)
MEILIKAGRLIFAIGLIGLGLLQFYFPGFRPMFIPLWPGWLPDPQLFIYLSSVGLIICAASVVFNFKPKKTNLILGCVFMALLLVFHVPFHIVQSTTSLGGWTNTFKILAFSGSAFIVAGSYAYNETDNISKPFLERLIPLGSIFFGIMMFVFGIDHFLYYQFVETLVPRWIPYPLFWTYFAGIALIGAGVSFIFRIKVKLIGILTSIMLFAWFLILHIPRAVTMPSEADNGNEITSVFQALAFSGVALVIALDAERTSA